MGGGGKRFVWFLACICIYIYICTHTHYMKEHYLLRKLFAGKVRALRVGYGIVTLEALSSKHKSSNLTP